MVKPCPKQKKKQDSKAAGRSYRWERDLRMRPAKVDCRKVQP